MQEETAYTCDSCGEEIVVPVDLSAGASQKFIEDCPICCCPHVIRVELGSDGSARSWAEPC